MTRVLIVDDDPVQLRLTAEIARAGGFEPVTADGGDAALALLRSDGGFGAVILDLVMPDRDGMAVMDAMARDGIVTPVIVQTAQSSLDAVNAAMRRGALDFFVKPVIPERLVVSLRNALKLGALESALRTAQARRDGRLSIADIASSAPAMRAALDKMARAARSNLPILIEGEAGTGKQLAARVIHAMSERAARPFVVLDCASPAADLTGAIASAQAGTLLLKSIGSLPAAAQARLADLLARPTDLRIIATTRRRLLTLAQTSGFREDLYYRLNVFPIYLPPLRDRREDLEPASRRILARLAGETGNRLADLSQPALDLLLAYEWPGNFRELEAVLNRALSLSAGGPIEPADLPQLLAQISGRDEARRVISILHASDPVHVDAPMPVLNPGPPSDLQPDRFLTPDGDIAPLDAVERELIAFALTRYSGRMSQVARALGIGRSTLYRKLHDYGLDAVTGRAA